MSRRKARHASFLIFHPSHLGLVWGCVERDGTAWFAPDPWFPSGENIVLANIIKSMRRGAYTKKGYSLRCVPNIMDKRPPRPKRGWLIAKRMNCTTLGKLFAGRKCRGSQTGLRTISEKDRYKGKVDWEAERGQITGWISDGISLGQISKRLSVSPSTLSEANKRYGLYTPKTPVA